MFLAINFEVAHKFFKNKYDICYVHFMYTHMFQRVKIVLNYFTNV